MLRADTPASSSFLESHGTAEGVASPSSPATHMFHLNDQHIKQEPLDNAFRTIPPAFEALDSKPTLSPLDPTQHSAAMLCDLQCRSSLASSNNARSPAINRSTSAKSFWATLFLHLMTLHIQTCYKALLVAIWTLSPSRMVRMMQASTHRLTFRSTTSSTMTTPLLSRSAAMAQRNAATSRLAQQGAFAALQRSSEDEGLGVRDRRQAVAARHQRVLRLRKALEQDVKDNHEVGKRDDGNAGV